MLTCNSLCSLVCARTFLYCVCGAWEGGVCHGACARMRLLGVDHCAVALPEGTLIACCRCLRRSALAVFDQGLDFRLTAV